MPMQTNATSAIIRPTRSLSTEASVTAPFSKQLVLPIVCAMSLTALSTNVYAEQWVKPRSAAPYFVSVGDTIHIQPEYSVTDPQFSEATGLGLRLHFASDALAFQQISHVFEIDSIGDSPQPNDDNGNHDSDDRTDKILVSSWLNINAKWPGEENLPTFLYKASFTVQEALTDATTINFTASSSDARTSFQSESFVICRKPKVSVSADKTELNEGDQALVSFQLSPALPAMCGDIMVQYRLTGEAENGVDFNTLSGELRFPAGEAVQQITLESINDNIEEAQESINLTLNEQGNYELASDHAVTLSILADNKPVTNEPVDANDPDLQNADPTGATDSINEQQGEGDVSVETDAGNDDKDVSSVNADNTGDKETVEVVAEDEKQEGDKEVVEVVVEDEKQDGDKEVVEVVAEDEKQDGDKEIVEVVTDDKKPSDEPPAPNDEQVLENANHNLLETTTHNDESNSESDSALDDKKALEAISKVNDDYPEETIHATSHATSHDKTPSHELQKEPHTESGKEVVDIHHTTTADPTHQIHHEVNNDSSHPPASSASSVNAPVNVPVDSPWMLALLSGLLALLGRFGRFNIASKRD